jgi:hypothetical protein
MVVLEVDHFVGVEVHHRHLMGVEGVHYLMTFSVYVIYKENILFKEKFKV